MTPHQQPGAPAHRTPSWPTRVAAALLLALGLAVTAPLAAQAAPVAAVAQAVAPSDAGDPILPGGGTSSDPLTGSTGGGDAQGQVAPAPQAPAQPSAAPTSAFGWVAVGLLVGISLLLTVIAFTTLWWMLHAWSTPDRLQSTRFSRRVSPDDLPRMSLLVPARHEEAVLGHTLDRLAATSYEDVEILAIIGHDDPGTEDVARAAARRHPGRVRVVIDHSVPKNKPKALNTALAEVTGDIVGVMDAEDEVHPELLANIAGRFAETQADVVQGGVQLMNFDSTWWSLRNVLEYYFWFRSRLHFHAGQRFIPLGGNTVFAKTDLLREVDGWDPECLAEDCEIGVRLSTRGATVAVAYDPELVTREETPGSLTSLLKQRTRWNQGFLQVLGKGIWKQLPTRRQRLLARYTLSMPFLQAVTGVMIPISVALVLFAKVPVWVTLITFLPIVPTIVTVVVEAAGLNEFAKAYDVKVRLRDYVKLVLGTIPYQVFLAAAAVRAVVRQARGDGSWEKTEHTGAHIGATDAPAIAAREELAA
ncbi:glycosyltransferase [Solicola sp. PLA-1-18]|uniref:glycosyltransferase n=1 Tax=Solicola sp. PLA-1-18 TaxID=3380532 RepID=UPI003B7F4DD6